jgi:hypothetical protein
VNCLTFAAANAPIPSRLQSGTLVGASLSIFVMSPEFMSLADRDSKVVGFFAYSTPTRVVCTGRACVVAGSEEAMKRYVSELDPGNRSDHTIRKTRFGEILQGLRLGGAYAFDSESYDRFYPLARMAALKVERADFEEAHRRGDKFFTVELLGS